MLRRVGFVLAIAAAHAILTVALTVSLFGSNMARFGTGAPPEPWAPIADAPLYVLSCPLLPLVSQLPQPLPFSGFPAEHVLFFANGLIWAIALVWLHRQYRCWKNAAQ